MSYQPPKQNNMLFTYAAHDLSFAQIAILVCAVIFIFYVSGPLSLGGLRRLPRPTTAKEKQIRLLLEQGKYGEKRQLIENHEAEITTLINEHFYYLISTLDKETLAMLPDSLFTLTRMEEELRKNPRDMIQMHDQLGRMLFITGCHKFFHNFAQRLTKEKMHQIDALAKTNKESNLLFSFSTFCILEYCNPKYLSEHTLMQVHGNGSTPLVSFTNSTECIEDLDILQAVSPLHHIQFGPAATCILEPLATHIAKAKEVDKSKLQLIPTPEQTEVALF